MSSLRFPVIETKKTVIEEEDYNFINKDKKKKTSSNPLELIEELKRKIDQQKKEIDNRNITIQGLQRNFQSLSVIVKNEKAQSAVLRAQLENLKLNSENGDKRATEFHEKCIMLEKENKSLKEELRSARKAHSECSQYLNMNEQFKKRIIALEQTNEKLHNKIMQADVDKKALEGELSKYKSTEKDRRLMNQRVIDLEEELKKMSDINNALVLRVTISTEEAVRLKSELQNSDKRIEEVKSKLRDSEKQKEKQQNEIDYLKKEGLRLKGKLQQYEKAMENKDLFSKLKQEDEQKTRKDYRTLMVEYNQLEQVYKRTEKESQEKSEMINFAHTEMDRLKHELEDHKLQFRSKQENYLYEISKLNDSLKNLHNQLNFSMGQSTSLNKKLKEEQDKIENYNEKVSSLHDNIDQMNRKMQQHHQRYSHYLKLIAANEPDVIISNEREMAKLENSSSSTLAKLNSEIIRQQSKLLELENTVSNQVINIQTMRKYIQNLQEQVSSKSREVLEKNKLLRKYEDEEDELNRMIESERKESLKIKQDAQFIIMERMKELENEKMKSQKEIEDERVRLEQQLKQEKERIAEKLKREQQKADRAQKLLEQYKYEQQKLKEMMLREQQQLSRLSVEKEEQIKRLIREKEEELEKQKKNNKLLWSDNKKLKDLENQLKEDSVKLIEEKEAAKKEEIERLKRELERKYKEDMSLVKDEESNANELKKILAQRTNQYKQLSQNFTKLKGEAEFYKNRNKQLESLVARVEKQFKEKTVDLQRQNKSNKQVIQVLDKKLKEAQSNLSELEKKQKKELKYLYDEIEEMRSKAKSQRIQEKVALVNKSMSDLDTSLKTLMNTMSCNYCVEVVKQCVRLECGHIYCKKCKGGYEPNCGQCKKKSMPSNDRMIDDSVSKAQYMRILVNTIKDDLSKLSL